MSSSSVACPALISDGATSIRAASVLNGGVQVDGCRSDTSSYPCSQEGDVEDSPGQRGDLPLESEVEQGREDEGEDGGR